MIPKILPLSSWRATRTFRSGSGIRRQELFDGLNPLPSGTYRPALPTLQCALINTKPRSHPLARETQLPSLGHKLLCERLWGWIRVVAKEADNSGKEADWGLSLPMLPVEDRVVVNSEPKCNVFLEKPQIQPPPLEVVT